MALSIRARPFRSPSPGGIPARRRTSLPRLLATPAATAARPARQTADRADADTAMRPRSLRRSTGAASHTPRPGRPAPKAFRAARVCGSGRGPRGGFRRAFRARLPAGRGPACNGRSTRPRSPSDAARFRPTRPAPDHVPSHLRVGHGLVDVAMAAVKPHVATDRVAAVVDKQLAFQAGRLIVDQFQGRQGGRPRTAKGLGPGGPLVVVFGNDQQGVGLGTGHDAADHAVGETDILVAPRPVGAAEELPHVLPQHRGAIHHVFAGQAIQGRSAAGTAQAEMPSAIVWATSGKF